MQTKTFNIHTAKSIPFDAFKANDEIALRAFYNDNYYKTEKYILDNSGTTEHAKDIYQEAFIAVWRNIQLDKFHPEKDDALEGYLYRIAKNKWLDYLRSAHHKKIVAISESADDIADSFLPEADEQYMTDVKKHFTNLGENCKKVLTGFYYRKESMKIIAEKFEWTEATARNNKYRCLQRLRELLKK